MLILPVVCFFATILTYSDARVTYKVKYKTFVKWWQNVIPLTSMTWRKIFKENIRHKNSPLCEFTLERSKKLCNDLLNLQEINDITGMKYSIEQDTRKEIKCQNLKFSYWLGIPLFPFFTDFIRCDTPNVSNKDEFKGANIYIAANNGKEYNLFLTTSKDPDFAKYFNTVYIKKEN